MRLLFLFLFLVSSFSTIAQIGWKRLTESNSFLSSDTVRHVFTATNGDLWVVSLGSITRSNGNVHNAYSYSDGVPSLDVLAIEEDENGNIWFGHGTGAFYHDGTSFISIPGVTDIIDHIVQMDDGLYLFKKYALGEGFKVKNGQVSVFSLPHCIARSKYSNSKFCFSPYFDPNKLFIYDSTIIDSIVLPDTVRITSSVFISDNEVMLTLAENGGSKSWLQQFKNKQVVHSFELDQSSFVGIDANNNHWFFYMSNYIERFALIRVNSVGVEYFNLSNGIVADETYDIHIDNQYVYMGTSNGLYQARTIENNSSIDTLTINNLRPVVSANGDLSSLQIPLVHPKSGMYHKDGVEMIGMSNLLFAGVDEQMVIRSSGSFLNVASSRDLFSIKPGRFDQYYSSGWVKRKVWKVSRKDIDYHIRNFMYSNYAIPQDILDWPALGNPYNFSQDCLAPFHDVNNDGIYNAEDGDYPHIRGDQAIYAIAHDQGEKYYLEKEIGLELHAMIYAFDSSRSELQNSIFAHYTILNKSSHDYTDFKIGVNLNDALGTKYSNYIGCDTSLNMFYVYKEDNNDENGFGVNPPAFGVVFLSDSMTNFATYRKSTLIDGHPRTSEEFYDRLNSRWLNGDPINYGGGGTSSTPPVVPTKFMYSGDPVSDTGWLYKDHYSSGRGRGIGAVAGKTFNSGDTLEFDIAYVLARDISKNNVENVTELRNEVKMVKDFFDAKLFPNWRNSCLFTQIEEHGKYVKQNIVIAPNPTSGMVSVFSEKFVKSISMYASDGRKVMEKTLINGNFTMDLSDQPHGIYFVRIHTKEGEEFFKIVKQ